MPRYSYKARDAQNRVISGVMEAAGPDEIAERLGDKELMMVSVSELNFDGTKKNQTLGDRLAEGWKTMQNRVPLKDVVFFTRQLATMVAGGVQLPRALGQLAKSEKPIFKKILGEVSNDLSSGHTFADALAKHPGAFNTMFVSIVHTGEVTGALDRVLDELATYMENNESMRAKVKGAMRYPVFIMLFVTVLIIGIMAKLVPTFESMYSSLGAKLPGLTQMLVTVSHFVQNYLGWIVLCLVGLVVLYKALLTQEGFRYQIDRFILKVPIFGTIIKKNIWAIFSRTLSLLMECGIPILQATETVAMVVGNTVYAKSLREVHENLGKGELLSASLEKTTVFPVLISQLVMTGEESGRIDKLLRKAAEFYEREIRVTIDSFASIIEPVLIIILGSVVGTVVVALYMPIFQMGKLMGK